MPTIEAIIRQVNRDLVPQFEEKLRAYLETQEKDWLIDQVIRLAMDAHSLQEMDRKQLQEAKARARQQRIERLRQLGLNPQVLADFLERFRGFDRPRLVQEGCLWESAPGKGGDLIGPEHRSQAGEALLQLAKDILFGLLFGDENTNTHFTRMQRELLTFTLPRFKSDALDFMKASTELSAAGTWQDPESVSNDARADNVIMEVEYGEVAEEQIGNGILRCLSLINNLEVNEQVLYARMMDIEQSTLIE